MAKVREAFAVFADELEYHLPDGEDKTHIMRKLRTCAMWCNVAITRLPDGTPRT